jgi:alpha-ketoglutarate-dependent taurine dioxygenase
MAFSAQAQEHQAGTDVFFTEFHLPLETRRRLKAFLGQHLETMLVDPEMKEKDRNEKAAATFELINSELKQILEAALAPFLGTSRAHLIRLAPDDQVDFTYRELHALNPYIGRLMGRLLPQNHLGDTVISVYDRDRTNSMAQGARYHQTREGGSIHTDNVNIPETWEYLLLSCLTPAAFGGESILTDGWQVHQLLRKIFPHALSTLEANFTWEMRGVKESLYHAPIITYDQRGKPLFRHLRPYMESAHQKAGVPLTPSQLFAVDALDAITNSSQVQVRLFLQKGDLLLNLDSSVLHGRTCYADAIEAVTWDEYREGRGQILKRTMERLWIKKN